MNASTQHAFEPEEVMAYLDGELEPRRAAALAGHLEHCSDCQALANQFRQVSERLLGFQVEAPSAKLQDAVHTALVSHEYPKESAPAAEHKMPGRWSRLWVGPGGWVLAGAMAVLMVAAVISLPRFRIAGGRGEFAAGKLSTPFESNEAHYAGQQQLLAPAFRGRSSNSSAGATNASEAADEGEEKPEQSGQQGPMIARTASLTIVAKDFGSAEAAVKAIIARYHGYIGELSTSSPQNSAHTLTATLHIPSAQLEAALAELKQLGRVEQESQAGEEVTKEYTDLAARLKNSRATEQRLLDVLRKNTGKVTDILKVEQEIARVRGEIEQMEADQRALKTRVDFAGVQLSVTEVFKASLQVTPPSTATRLHNAVVTGYRDLVDGVIGFFVWLLEAGPTLLLWAAILFFPARWVWNRWLRAKWLSNRSPKAA
jgi:hypothetical protein